MAALKGAVDEAQWQTCTSGCSSCRILLLWHSLSHVPILSRNHSKAPINFLENFHTKLFRISSVDVMFAGMGPE